MADLIKILLVDDNPKYIEDVLPYYGYEVTCAYNGMQAIEKLNQDNSFDLVLLDVMMPEMNGWETLKAIRNSKTMQDLPVIMVTAVNEDQKMVSGLKIGADDYIVKPFILPNLLARIEALIRRSNWNKTNKEGFKASIEAKDNIAKLTQREMEILKMVSKGASNADIAEKLFVKEVTIKTHLNSIYKKLNVENRVQAVLLAIETQIIK